MLHTCVSLLFLTVLALMMNLDAGLAADGLAMLKNDHSARAAGMGAAYVAVTHDPNATVYNPAAAATVREFTASFGHTFFWDEVRLESGYLASNLMSNVHIHGGIRYAAIDNLEARDRPSSEPLTVFNAHDLSLKTGLAYRFSDRVAAGFGLGWFMEEIEAWRGWAFNVDLGLLAMPVDEVHIGAAVTNIGSDFQLAKSGYRDSRDISLPTTYRLGATYRYQDYLGALDVVVVDDDFRVHTGAEAQLHELFMLRAGYMFNYDTKSFTAGASFSRRNLRADYAFVPFSENLGSSHIFNFTFSL